MAATNVLMVFPRFNQNSFWSLQSACDIYRVKCPAPPLGLMTLAALLPSEWNIRLINRNAQDLNAADIDWADIVMTGGMLPQREDTLTVIGLAHAHGKPVAVGGPDPPSGRPRDLLRPMATREQRPVRPTTSITFLPHLLPARRNRHQRPQLSVT